jgi:hypothetical protein
MPENKDTSIQARMLGRLEELRGEAQLRELFGKSSKASSPNSPAHRRRSISTQGMPQTPVC